MNTSRRRIFQKLADILTLLCIVTTGILVLFLIFGPKTGMEAMIILIPWMLAGAVHLTLGLGALVCAWLSGAPWRNSWIYIYFLLFFGCNAYYLIVFNQMDIAAARKIDDLRAPGESERYERLRPRAAPRINAEDIERARELVRTGADLTYRRQTPEAAVAVAGALLDHGADSEAASPRGWTPLGRAAKNGHTDLARLLIAKGADVSAKTDDGRTPLMESLWAGHREIAASLLTAGADPRQAVRWGPNGGFPLKAAAARQDTAMVGMLIEALTALR